MARQAMAKVTWRRQASSKKVGQDDAPDTEMPVASPESGKKPIPNHQHVNNFVCYSHA